MKVAIMQPTYLPWLGYFDLMDQVEVFVILDDVQFAKRSWQQRNRIKTRKGFLWLTVPVFSKGLYEQKIYEVKIADEEFWRKHIKSIEVNYSDAPYKDVYLSDLYRLMQTNNQRLLELNLSLIKFIAGVLKIKTQLIISSELKIQGKRSEKLAKICNYLGAKVYLSPIGSLEYISSEIEFFQRYDIDVVLHNYEHPVYNQLFPPFLPYMSVIDLLFNEGERSIDIIRSGRKQPLNLEEAQQLNEKLEVFNPDV